MPTLTTVDGNQITFAAKAIFALTDHDAATGEAVTCVYGVVKAVLHTKEAVDTLMTRLKMAKSFAQLTRANGSPIWINGGGVSSIYAPPADDYVTGVNAVISIGGLFQGVQETPDKATDLINKHGGSL